MWWKIVQRLHQQLAGHNFFTYTCSKGDGGLQNENLCSFLVGLFPLQVEIKPIEVRLESFFFLTVNIIVQADPLNVMICRCQFCVFHGLLSENVKMVIPFHDESCASYNRGQVSECYYQNEIHNVIAITFGADISDKCYWVVVAMDFRF